MAYPWELAGDDPLNYGLLQAGGALLTPERMGGGMGPAVSRFGQTVANQRNIDQQQELTKLKIDAYRRNAKSGEGLPSNVRTALWYANASPEERKAFEYSVRNSTVKGPNGEVYAREADGSLRRLTDVEQTIVERQSLAGATAHGKGAAESQYEVKEGVDAKGNPVFKTTAQLLQELSGQQRSPFSGMAYNPAMARVGPPAQQAPQDYPATAAGLNQARTDLAAQFPGGGMPPPMGATRPPSAATLERKREAEIGKGEGEAVVAARNLEAKLPEVQDIRSLGNTLKTHPGKKWAVGVGGLIPDALQFPDSSHADFMSFWEQTQGKQFAQAYETLKGAGQITVVESTKAQSALSRLANRKQTKESWDKAVDDFVDSYEAGMKKINARALGQQPQPIGVKKDWDSDKESRYQEWKSRQ